MTIGLEDEEDARFGSAPPAKEDDDNLFEKLQSKLHLDRSPPSATASQQKSQLEAHHSHRARTPSPSPSREQGFLHKLADQLEGEGHLEAASQIPVAPAPARKEDGSIWDGLADFSLGKTESPPPPPPPEKNLLEKMGAKMHRTKSGEREGEVPSSKKGEGLLEKLEGLAGGGVKGEEREDALNKSIDWVQKVLGSTTDQSDESAAEQAKDRVIASQIRNQYERMTGKTFPLKKKDDDDDR
ncbi:hypothetical protein BDY24DRAFT_444609 [Mrakia frigida]|uniref:uncharacterized protein n=1 Tax=Mrakia frigida TaxID=29902 RepID=UPI003FCC1807